MIDSIYIGQMIYEWTIIAGPIQKHNRIKHWTCRCNCGNIRDIKDYNLRKGLSHNCGCHKEVSRETRQLLSDRRRGQPSPWAKGRKHSQESIEKMKETKRLKKLQREGDTL